MLPLILVADDEQAICDSLERFFLPDIDKFQLRFALSGEQAIEMLRQDVDNQIKILIVDLMMPKVDGFQVLSYVQRENLNIKPIIISAYGDVHNIRKGMQYRAYDFLIKPIDPYELASIINTLLTHPSTSSQIGLSTLERLVTELPSEKKTVFIQRMLPKLKLEQAQQIGNYAQELVVADSQALLEQQKSAFIDKLAQKQKSKEISTKLNLTQIKQCHKLYVDQRQAFYTKTTTNQQQKYTYYILKYRLDGKSYTHSLKNYDPRKEFPLLFH